MGTGLETAAAKGVAKKAAGMGLEKVLEKTSAVELAGYKVNTVVSLKYQFPESDYEEVQSKLAKMLNEEYDYSDPDSEYPPNTIEYGEKKLYVRRDVSRKIDDFSKAMEEDWEPSSKALTLYASPLEDSIEDLEVAYNFLTEFRSKLRSNYPEKGSKIWIKLYSSEEQPLQNVVKELENSDINLDMKLFSQNEKHNLKFSMKREELDDALLRIKRLRSRKDKILYYYRLIKR